MPTELRNFHCEVTGGALTSTHMLVTNPEAPNSFRDGNVFVFSMAYLNHDWAFRNVIFSEQSL